MAVRIAHPISYFSPAALRWVPVLAKSIQRSRAQSIVNTKPLISHFDIVSWNIDYCSSQPSRRCRALIDHLFKSGAPDILCLQEVRSEARATLLGDRKICNTFLTTDAHTNLEDKNFTTMTLLSKKRFVHGVDSEDKADGSEDEDKFIVGPAFREQLPSATGREALCVDLILPYAPNSFIRIINVHLESCDAFAYRAQLLKQVTNILHEPGCSGGLIVGDFNSVTEEDHKLIEENKLEDAWLTLYGDTDSNAPTWSVGRRMDSRYEPKRLDKVVMVGLAAETVELIHPLCIDMPGGTPSEIVWSDHSGLRCRFCF